MAGEAYQVDYIINLQDRASAGIANFSRAASRLTAAAENLKKFETTFNNVVGKFSKPLKMSIDTANAHRSLDKILKKIQRIQTEARKVNIGVVGNPAGNGSGRGGGGNRQAPVVAPVRRQAPRPLVGSRAGQPLVPRNLEYQVLGPTRLGNVAMLDMFKGMGLMYGISAIGSGIRDIISQSTDYENIMQTAKNILKTNYKGGNFNANFIDLERIAREVGVETKFTAPEVADAVKFLAMAGLDINAIKKSIRPIADIALIGDTDLGQTADVMTNIMTAYGIKPEDMRKTADVMTRTFTMSNTTLMELAESFKMAGSMLHLANVPFETAAAAFGVLGDAGIKATMAGTTMRTIMNNLRNPTKNQQKYWDMLGVRRYDDYGNLREINDIFADLNKLNGNDARSAKAREQYEALQKQYAPKFEGLQEGSEEWNKLTAEYDKASEEIRRKFGGVDVFRLFRLTAASGAGVLMNSVEKWNRVIEENFLSQGLSERLAEEKKNTIAGMWAQLKSAFQEGGLKVFEENDGRLRGYLRKGITWLKSDQFTTLLRSVIDLVADLGEMLVWFTKHVINFYNKFAPIIKAFLKFQLILKGVQLIAGSFKQVGNTLLYMLSPFARGFAGMPMAQRMMPGAAGYAGAMARSYYGGAMVPGAAGGLAPGTNPFLAYWATGRPGKGRPVMPEPILNRAPYAYNRGNIAIPANPTFVPMASYNQRWAAYNKQMGAYNRRVRAANIMTNWGGVASMAGMGLGGYIGNRFNEQSGMMWGGMIGSTALPMLFSAGPWGIFAGAAITAIAGVTSYFVKFNRELDQANKRLSEFNSTEARLGLRNIDVSDAESVFRANIRLSTSALVNENEALRLKLELMQKIANFGTDEHEEAAQGVPLEETQTGQTFLGLLKDYQVKVKENWSLGEHMDHWLPWIKDPDTWRQATRDFANNHEQNPRYKEGSDYIRKGIYGIRNLQEWEDFTKWYQQEGPGYTPSANMLQGVGLTDKDVSKLNDSEFYRLAEFAGPTNAMLQRELNFSGYKEFARLVGSLTATDVNDLGNYHGAAQQALQNLNFDPYVSELFNYQKYGWFGSQDWIENMRKLREQQKLTYYDENGIEQNVNFPTAKIFNNFIEGMYRDIANVYDQLNPEIRPYFDFLLDKSYWESIGGGLDLSQYSTQSSFAPLIQPDENGGNVYRIPNYSFDSWSMMRKSYEPATPTAGNTNSSYTNTTAYNVPWLQVPSDTVPPLNNDAFRPAERRVMADAIAQATVTRPINIYINSDALIKADKIDAETDEGKLQEKVHDSLVNILDDVAGMFGGQFNTGVA